MELLTSDITVVRAFIKKDEKHDFHEYTSFV
jgi:hypothetical protein